MSAENKTLARRVIEEVWNQQNIAAAEQMFAPDYVMNTPDQRLTGLAAFKEFHKTYCSAFPDQRFTIEDLIAEGDRIVTRWTVEGTHKGDLLGTPASGKRVRVNGITISRIQNGKVVEEHAIWDALGLAQQIGAAGGRSATA